MFYGQMLEPFSFERGWSDPSTSKSAFTYIRARKLILSTRDFEEVKGRMELGMAQDLMWELGFTIDW